VEAGREDVGGNVGVRATETDTEQAGGEGWWDEGSHAGLVGQAFQPWVLAPQLKHRCWSVVETFLPSGPTISTCDAG